MNNTLYISTRTTQTAAGQQTGFGVVATEGDAVTYRTDGMIDSTVNIAPIRVLGAVLSATGVTQATVYLRHKWALTAVTEYLPKWRENGFVTASKQPVKYAELWQRVDALIQAGEFTFVGWDDSPHAALAHTMSVDAVDLAAWDEDEGETEAIAEAAVAAPTPPVAADEPPVRVYDDTDVPPIEEPAADEAQAPVAAPQAKAEPVVNPTPGAKATPKPEATTQASGDANEVKKVFVHGRGYASPEAIQYARRVLDRIEEVGGVLVTTDDAAGIDRFLTIEANKRGLRHIVIGLDEKPTAKLGEYSSYYRYSGQRSENRNLALYQRNYTGASRCDSAVIITTERYEDKDRKFADRIAKDFKMKTSAQRF